MGACVQRPGCHRGFDISDRFTIVDYEKSIDTEYRAAMKDAQLFLDALNIKKNISSVLGADHARSLALYDCALYDLSTSMADSIILLYGSRQA